MGMQALKVQVFTEIRTWKWVSSSGPSTADMTWLTNCPYSWLRFDQVAARMPGLDFLLYFIYTHTDIHTCIHIHACTMCTNICSYMYIYMYIYIY